MQPRLKKKTPRKPSRFPKLSPQGFRQWVLLEDFHWDIGHKNSGLRVVVPAGFIFNGASVPLWAWWIMRPEDPQVMPASLVHDFLYCEGQKEKTPFTKVVADAIFYEILVSYGFSRPRAIPAYLAVRMANDWRGVH